MKNRIIIGIITTALILGGFVLFAQENTPKEYTNKDVGISFTLPSSDWNISEKAIKSSDDEWGGHYWIHATNGVSELSFDVRKFGKVGGFVLSTSTKSMLHKATSTDNVHIWRPKESVIKNKSKLVRMYRQPEEEMVSYGDKRAFNFIFPEFNRRNNVGELFDSGSGRFVNEPFSVSISGGIDLSDNTKRQLNKIDSIIKSLSFSDPEKNDFYVATSTESTENWHTYKNKNHGFSIRYPNDYNSFIDIGTTEDQLMEVEATSTKAILINGGYNHYPTLSVSVFPIESYEYGGFYGLSIYYDKESKECYKIEDGVRKAHPYSISNNEWSGCKIGTGDAGWSSEGYAIPLEEKGIVVQVTKSSYYGSRRPSSFKTIVKSLEVFNN